MWKGGGRRTGVETNRVAAPSTKPRRDESLFLAAPSRARISATSSAFSRPLCFIPPFDLRLVYTVPPRSRISLSTLLLRFPPQPGAAREWPRCFLRRGPGAAQSLVHPASHSSLHNELRAETSGTNQIKHSWHRNVSTTRVAPQRSALQTRMTIGRRSAISSRNAGRKAVGSLINAREDRFLWVCIPRTWRERGHELRPTKLRPAPLPDVGAQGSSYHAIDSPPTCFRR